MTFKQLNYLLEEIESDIRLKSENIRLLMYSVFQSQSTKKLKLTDIMKFSWDNNSTEEEVEIDKNKYITKESALKIINKINKNING